MALINGKQLRNNTLKEVLLLVTGGTATDGQILAYDAGSGGFSWVNNTGGVGSVTAGDGLSGNTTTGNVTLVADVDNSSIYIDSGKISLGDPTNNNLISGGDYTFAGSLIVNGDFTVLGTATTINTQTLSVEDNIITLNSTFTAGTPTVNAGIEVLRGSENTVELRWNELGGQWWEISNPEGSGTTYSAILTTASLETGSTAISIVQGTGSDADKLTLDVVEENFSNIPNSALQNSSFSTTNDGVVTATTSVSLGGTLDVGLAPGSVKEFHLDATNTATDNYILSFDSGSGGFTWVDPGAVANDTYVTGGTASGISDNSNNGSITLSYINDEGGGPYTLDYTDTYVTGGTVTGSNLVLHQNDGTNTTNIDLSSLDVNDTFSTGTTNSVTATNSSNTQSTDITGNAGFSDFTVSFTDTFTTGGTLSGNNILLHQNDGSDIPVDISGADFNDTFSTGATISNGTLNITGNDGFTPYNATGTIVQSVSGNSPITASTVNGAVTVGIDYTSLQSTSPTTSDKNLAGPASGTTGNNSATYITITDVPAGSSYVGVSVNGVWYSVGNGLEAHFADTPTGASVVPTQGKYLVWNGTTAKFELDGSDRIDLYYDVLQ